MSRNTFFFTIEGFDNLSPSQFGGFGANQPTSNAGIEGFLGESPLTSPGSKPSRRIGAEQTVIPVSIKQVMSSEEPAGSSPFKLDGKEVANVLLCIEYCVLNIVC